MPQPTVRRYLRILFHETLPRILARKEGANTGSIALQHRTSHFDDPEIAAERAAHAELIRQVFGNPF